MSLRAFLLRRLAGSVTAIVGVCLLVFLFLHIVPGDPVDNLAGGEATPEQRAEIVSCMHLDRPLWTQLGIFLGHVADGTLGRQCPDAPRKSSVAARIGAVFPYTLELASAGQASPPPARLTRPAVSADTQSSALAGRNDPCPCGSGRKYKKCCLAR